MYSDGLLWAIDATLTIDTGVCDTIVYHHLFERISEDCRSQLLEAFPQGGAGHEPSNSYDKVAMEIWMGPLCSNHMCAVADILDEVQLGEDLLLCGSSGPTNIIQSEEKMMFRRPPHH